MKPYKWCRYCDKIKSECKCARPSIVLCENDHLEAVKQARADTLRWVLEQLDSHSGLSPGCIGHEISIQRRAVYAERLRLRTIIEKELSK